jgi:hypothetical protein
VLCPFDESFPGEWIEENSYQPSTQHLFSWSRIVFSFLSFTFLFLVFVLNVCTSTSPTGATSAREVVQRVAQDYVTLAKAGRNGGGMHGLHFFGLFFLLDIF